MAITYQLTDTAADCGLIAACSGATVLAGGGRKANGGATPGTVEVTANVPSSTTRAVFGIEITPGEAVSWDSGNAVVRLNFTTGHMNVLIQGIHICRVNSSCGSVESLGSETGLGIPTTGGVSIDRTIAISAVASPGEGDKLYIVVVVHNDDSMNSRTVGVTPNGQIDLPWTEEEAPEFSASVVDENPAQGDSAEASSSAPESASAAVADSNPAQVDSAAGRVTVPLVVHAADRKVMGATTAANGITSVDRPDNVSAGDLILIYWLTRNRNQFPDQPPAGFTLLHSFGSTSTTANPWVRFYGKIATASEPASYEVITQEPASFSGLQRIGSERITGHHPNILDVLSGSPTGVTTDDSGPASADIPGIETLHAGCVIYAVGIRRNVNENVSFSPTGWTPTGASIQANHFSAAVGYRFVEDAEQQPDINVSSATGARTTGAMIALRPAGVVEEEGFSGEVTDETPAQGDSAAATQAAPGPQATAGVADENPAQEDSSVGASSPTPPPQATRIRPSPTHPRYWEYDGKTRLFLGATSQDNPFQHPTGLGVENGHNDTLEEHLDRMVAAGGNYIRCTLSTRDHTLPDARLRFPWAWDEGEEAYDLDVWNEDFFERLDWMLGLCEARGIVVGLEFFDAFDWTDSETNAWTLHPMRPANNVNYSTATGVPDTWTATPTNSNQPVFTSVLASNSLNDPELIAGYLEAYVHRVLGVTFQHPNVLYIVSNETSLPAEYSFHFIDLIKARAVADDVDEVHVTEMLNENDLTHASHVVFYDEVPGRVSFHEASQVGHPQGDTRWERLIAQRGLTDDPDRPINVTKVYYRPPPLNSAHPPREATRALWQYVLSGVSVARYHRSATLASTPSGIGLVTESINGIRSVRKVEAVFDLIGAVPAMGLLSDRAADCGCADGSL